MKITLLDPRTGRWLAAILLVWACLTSSFLPGEGYLGVGTETQVGSPSSSFVARNLWMAPLSSGDVVLTIDGSASRVEVDGEMLERSSTGQFSFCREKNGWMGLHQIRIHFGKSGGSLRIGVSNGTPPIRYLLHALLILFAFWLASTKAFEPKEAQIFLVACLLRLLYGFAIRWDDNSPDIAGHMDYIRLLASRLRIPEPGECWQCYQPPMFYGLMVPVYKLGAGCESISIELLRATALAISMWTLRLGMTCVSEALAWSRDKMSCLELYAYFPAGIYFAPVISNDALVNLSGMAALLLALRFRGYARIKDLWGAIGCGIVASLFKSNGLLYLMAVLAVVPWHPSDRRRNMRGLLAWCGGFLLAGGWLAGVNALRSMGAETRGDGLVGNVGRLAGRVAEAGNGWDRFLPGPGQLRLLLTPELTYPQFKEALQGFWTCFIRSSLLDYMAAVPGGLWAWSLVLLAILGGGICLLVLKGAFLRSERTNMLWLLGFLAALMAFRWRYPFFCSANIRYVMGIVLPFSILAGCGLGGIRGKKMNAFWQAWVSAFARGAALFYLTYSLAMM